MRRPSSEKSSRFALAAAIVVITVVAVGYCMAKSGMFLDEIFSFGLANSGHGAFLIWNDEAISRADIVHYLTGDDNLFNYASVFSNQADDVHPPLFYLILHTVSSLAGGSCSKWVGLSINLVFFALSIWVLALLAKKLFDSSTITVFIICMFALNSITLSALLLIRMYTILGFFTISLAYGVVCYLESPSACRLVPIFACVYLGLLTQYFFIFYAICLLVACLAYLCMNGRGKHALSLVIVGVAASLCMLATFPACIEHLMGTESVSGGGVSARALDPDNYIDAVSGYADQIAKHAPLVTAANIVAAIAAVIVRRNKSDRARAYTTIQSNYLRVILIPAFVALALIMVAAPYKSLRYVSHLMPLFALLSGWLICMLSSDTRTQKRIALAIIIATLVSNAIASPRYLYLDVKQYEEKLDTCQNAACVCIAGADMTFAHSDLIQLMRFDTVFKTDDVRSARLSDYLSENRDRDTLVLLISNEHDQSAIGSIHDVLGATYGYNVFQKIHSGDYSTTYVLRRTA